MKLIKPSEISAKILTLLDESDERVIIVSPYMKISKWYKFLIKLNRIKSRGIPAEVFVRDDHENTATYSDLHRLSLEYKKIPHLHCKFYMNEKYGIVTSMNLLLSSEINSLEIAYSTETMTEYNELLVFYYRYIHMGEPILSNPTVIQPTANMKEIMDCIRGELNRYSKNPWLRLADNSLQICTSKNNYNVVINEGCLSITAYLRAVKVSQISSPPVFIDRKENRESHCNEG